MLGRILAVAVATAALGAPAALAAPTLSTDQQCYAVGRDVTTLTGSGFTPNGQVAFALSRPGGDPGTFTATANSAGGLVVRVKVPSFDWFGLGAWQALALPVTATDTALAAANPALGPAGVTATATSTYTDWGVRAPAWEASTKGHPRQMMTVTAIGWRSEGKVIYAHYTRGGKLVKTIRVGALTAPCGNLTRHMRQFPFRPVAAGTWRVQFDTSLDYRVPGESYTVYRPIRVAAAEAIR
jgi:hypothetical protein